MPGNSHNEMMKKLIQIGKCSGFRVYAANQVDEKTINLPKTIDLTTLTSVNEIDVIWFDEFNFPKYAFEIECSTGVDRGMYRLYQLRHFSSCRLFIVLDDNDTNYKSYKSKFEKLIESDPLNRVADSYNTISKKEIIKLYEETISLTRDRYNMLDWEYDDDDVLEIIHENPDDTGTSSKAEKAPSWVDSGEINWTRNFTNRKEIAKILFEDFIVNLKSTIQDIKCNLKKYHISIYYKANMISVIYTRKDRLIFQIKNIESLYDSCGLETIEKPEGDTIISSTTRYIVYKEKSEMNKILNLFISSIK